MVKRALLVVMLLSSLCCMAQDVPLYNHGHIRSAAAFYTEAVKRLAIHRDSIAAHTLATKALYHDAKYAPAMHLLSRLERDTKRAVKYAEDAYRRDTTNLHYRDNLVEHLIKDEDIAGLKSILEQTEATLRDPRHLLLLAEIYIQEKDFERAEKSICTAEERFGHNVEFTRRRIKILLLNNKHDEAIAEVQRSIDIAPYMVENHILLSHVYSAIGRYNEAEAAAREALRVDGDNIDVYEVLSQIYLQQHRFGDYLESRRLPYANPKIPAKIKIDELRELWGYKELKPYLQHLEGLTMLIADTHPQDTDAQLFKAMFYVSLQRYDDALTTLRKEQLKDNLEVINHIIYILNTASRHEEALAEVVEAQKLFPQDLGLYMTKAHILTLLKRYKEAAETAQTSLRYSKDDKERSTIYEMLGNIYHELGKKKACYAAYEKALACNENNAGVLNNYAYFFALEGRNLDRALTMIKKATEINASSPTFLDTHAWILYCLGRYEEAKRIQQQALSLDTTSHPEFALHYGDILYALGDEFMAQTYWNKALEQGADKAEVEKRLNQQKRDKKKR